MRKGIVLPGHSLTYRCAIPALLCAATTPHVASSHTNKRPILQNRTISGVAQTTR